MTQTLIYVLEDRKTFFIHTGCLCFMKSYDRLQPVYWLFYSLGKKSFAKRLRTSRSEFSAMESAFNCLPVMQCTPLLLRNLCDSVFCLIFLQKYRMPESENSPSSWIILKTQNVWTLVLHSNTFQPQRNESCLYLGSPNLGLGLYIEQLSDPRTVLLWRPVVFLFYEYIYNKWQCCWFGKINLY
jgi:hypothetical protein